MVWSTIVYNEILACNRFIQFGLPLPEHAQSAMKILFRVCHSAPVQVALVNLFTANQVGTSYSVVV